MKVGCQLAFSDFTTPSYIAEAGAVVEAVRNSLFTSLQRQAQLLLMI